MSGDLPPIPQLSEIVAFLVRNLSHVDDINETALKKKLQRMREGTPLSVDVAMDLLDKSLAPLVRASGGRWYVSNTLRKAAEDYVSLCLSLDCAALPARAVRSAFDRMAVANFELHLSVALNGSGVRVDQVLGCADQATALIWNSRLKDRSVRQIATELDAVKALRGNTESWEKGIRRWSKGTGTMKILTILDLMEHWDLNFGYSLLLAHAYRNYCALELVDASRHVLPSFPLHGSIQDEIASLVKGEFVHYCALPDAIEWQVNELTRLIDPQRVKQPGDAALAAKCISRIEAGLEGQPRIAGLSVLRGLYEIQLGNRKEALAYFERAAEWFAWRGAPQMKMCLHHILNLASSMKEKDLLKRWSGWSEALGMAINIRDPELAMNLEFQHPFTEAELSPRVRPVDRQCFCQTAWNERQPDLRNTNRKVKGIGSIRKPQLSLFDVLEQPGKVRHLLEASANPDSLDEHQASPLLNAIQGGNAETVQILLPVTSCEVINTRSQMGTSPLHEAISARKPDWVRALVKRGADVELPGTQEQTPLFGAVSLFHSLRHMQHGLTNPAIVEQYIGSLPPIALRSSSPFREDQARELAAVPIRHQQLLHEHVAALEDCALTSDSCEAREIISILLDAGADVNARVIDQMWTPFLYSAEIGNQWLLRTLVDHGADPRSRLPGGETALVLLNVHGHAALVAELMSWLEPVDRLWLRENGRTSHKS